MVRSAVTFDLPVLAGGLPGHRRWVTDWVVGVPVLGYQLAFVLSSSGFTAMPLARTKGRTTAGGHV